MFWTADSIRTRFLSEMIATCFPMIKGIIPKFPHYIYIHECSISETDCSWSARSSLWMVRTKSLMIGCLSSGSVVKIF